MTTLKNRTPAARSGVDRSRPSQRAAAASFLVVMLLITAACGPLAVGDVARVDYRRDATYTVPADSALTASWRVGLDAVGLTPQRVENTSLNWIPAGTRAESANIANRLVTLADPEVDDGWQLRLWQARLYREPAASGYVYHLDLEVRVDVPADAFDLTRRVSGRIVGRDGDGSAFTFLVRAE
ncbi:MAG: hypothetical protein WD336_00560 [Trueperaceae bacterium]